MPILTAGAGKKRGWLEVSPQWLASIWSLRATGVVRVESDVILVEVEGVERDGDRLEGHAVAALVPTGVTVKGPRRTDT